MTIALERNQNNVLIEAIMVRDLNDRLALLDAAKQKDVEVDLSAKIYSTTRHLNMIQVMARLGYSAGSEIGLIIVALSIGDTLKDMKLNKQFLIKGTKNKVDIFKLKKVFPNIGKGAKVGYDRVFKAKDFLQLTDVLGRRTFMLLALKDHVEAFVKQIESIGELYQEDLVKIGKDLGIIATVVSEIEIDAAKKPWIKNGIPEVSSYMADKMNLRSRNLAVNHNFRAFIDSIKNPEINQPVDFECVIKENGYPLSQFDDMWEREYNTITNSPEYLAATKEEQSKMIYFAKKNLLDDCYIVDPLSEFSNALHAQQVERINTLIGFYKISSDAVLNFNMGLKGEKAEAAKKLKYMTIKVVNMLNYIFANKKDMSLPNANEINMDFRNVLYTYGEKLGLSAIETFCTCADAGWYKISKDNLFQKKTSYSFKAMETLFSNEIKYFLKPELMRQTIDIELPEEIYCVKDALRHGLKLNFNDGEALICESEEFGELYAYRNDVEDYNGTVVVEVDAEGYVTFREELAVFKFDRVEFIAFDAITNATMKDENLMNREIIEALKQTYITNKVDGFAQKFYSCMLKSTDTLDVQAESIKAFNNYITLALNTTAENRFGIFTHGYVGRFASLLHNEEKGRMMGRVLASHTQTSLADAKFAKPHTTGVGSIVIIKK